MPTEPTTRPLRPRTYLWVALAAVAWMLLLFWLTRAFNVPAGSV